MRETRSYRLAQPHLTLAIQASLESLGIPRPHHTDRNYALGGGFIPPHRGHFYSLRRYGIMLDGVSFDPTVADEHADAFENEYGIVGNEPTDDQSLTPGWRVLQSNPIVLPCASLLPPSAHFRCPTQVARGCDTMLLTPGCRSPSLVRWKLFAQARLPLRF